MMRPGRMGLLLIGLLWAGVVSAQPDQLAEVRAADAVVGVFFDRASREAGQTLRDQDDDARVDRWLSRCAALSGGRPAVQAAFYRRLMDRASDRRGGEREALGYMLRLFEAQPRHPWCSTDVRTLYYERAYESADRTGRAELAEPYIELLLEVAQGHERAWNIGAAQSAQQRALSVARSTRSPWREVLDDYGRTLSELDRAQRRLAQLQADAGQDPVAARTLAVRLACGRSDFDGAILAAEASGDDDLLARMRYAARPVNDLEPMQALAVAEMFHALADDPALELDRAKLGALQEAGFYFQHFLFCYTARDAVRLRVSLLTESLPVRIAELQPDPIRRPAGPWRNLVNGIAEPRVGNPGNLVNGKHLRVRNNTVYANGSAFTIPARLDESYDLRMAITLTHANNRDGMSLYFPIGARRGGRLILGAGGDDSCRFNGLAPIERLARFRFPEDRPVGMVLGVHPVGGGDVHLTLSLDGTEVFDWTGPIRALNVGDRDRPPRRQGNIFRVGAGTTYEFQQIEVRRAAEE